MGRGALTVDLVPLGDVDGALLSSWRDLADRAAEPNPFHEPEVVLPARHLGARRVSLLVYEAWGLDRTARADGDQRAEVLALPGRPGVDVGPSTRCLATPVVHIEGLMTAHSTSGRFRHVEPPLPRPVRTCWSEATNQGLSHRLLTSSAGKGTAPGLLERSTRALAPKESTHLGAYQSVPPPSETCITGRPVDLT